MLLLPAVAEARSRPPITVTLAVPPDRVTLLAPSILGLKVTPSTAAPAVTLTSTVTSEPSILKTPGTAVPVQLWPADAVNAPPDAMVQVPFSLVMVPKSICVVSVNASGVSKLTLAVPVNSAALAAPP